MGLRLRFRVPGLKTFGEALGFTQGEGVLLQILLSFCQPCLPMCMLDFGIRQACARFKVYGMVAGMPETVVIKSFAGSSILCTRHRTHENPAQTDINAIIGVL